MQKQTIKIIITLFPTLCKIYEMVLLNRLENYVSQKGLFSDMQFGFKEGVGCTEASFTILEIINHKLEWGSKVFSCFLDVLKAFGTVWIEGLLYKLFSEFGIGGKMWLVIKDLYTGVRERVLYSGSLSREFDVLQGTGQGRILAPFMFCKVRDRGEYLPRSSLHKRFVECFDESLLFNFREQAKLAFSVFC